MITALSPGLTVRSEILTALQADANLSALGVTFYPGKLPNKPVRPFGIVRTPSGAPVWRDGTAGGSDLSGIVDVFAGPTDAHPDAEAFVAAANAHVVRILNDLDVVAEGMSIAIHPTGDQIIRDGDEADGWHGMLSYDAAAT